MKKKKMTGMKKYISIMKNLHPADISLFLFLCVLIIQSGYAILVHENDSPFDVIVRTSASSPFSLIFSADVLLTEMPEK